MRKLVREPTDFKRALPICAPASDPNPKSNAF
jgi:hypothetical protein